MSEYLVYWKSPDKVRGAFRQSGVLKVEAETNAEAIRRGEVLLIKAGYRHYELSSIKAI